jgi:hypothetical protein
LPYPVTAAVTEISFRVRCWVRGLFPLARLPKVGDKRQYFRHLWPDRDESTRAAVDAVLTARPAILAD